MKKILGSTIVILLAAVPTVAQEVHIDYDRWARFSTFETFDYVSTQETSLEGVSPLADERIRDAIIAQMSAGRLKHDTSDPDLYVTYHTSSKDAIRVDTHSWGYGYPSNWHWDPYWGYSGTTTTVRSYTQGTFILDIWHAREKTLVWRGSAIATVSDNPEKNIKKIEKAIKKLAKKWQKMKPGF
jgi:hypothetical protein